MPLPQNLSPEERSHFYRRSSLAVCCLLMVAALHLFRVLSYDQSRWKGGGFGMFSTIDAETNRFLRVYILHADQQLPIEIPESLAKRALELRALPRQDLAEAFADKLLELRWEEKKSHDLRVRKQLRSVAQTRPITASDLNPPAGNSATTSLAEEPSVWIAAPASRAPETTLSPAGIRIEIYRLQFTAATGILKSEPILQLSRSRPEGDHE